MQSDGNPADAEVSMNAVDRAALRKAAFGCVLRLARIPSFESLMTPEQWHQTSRVMQVRASVTPFVSISHLRCPGQVYGCPAVCAGKGVQGFDETARPQTFRPLPLLLRFACTRQ